MKTIEVFTLAELKESHPSAFARVLKRWVEMVGRDDAPWSDETMDSFKRVGGDIHGVRMMNANQSVWAPDGRDHAGSVDISRPGEWTPARVREELPRISCVMPDGRKVTGDISGRCNRWATVHVDGMPGGSGFMFSWDTLANCLNSGRYARI